MKKGERNEASFLPFVLCQDERVLILKYGLVVLADVGVGVQQDEADNQGVNGQRFDECEGKNHGTGDFAAHFRIAGNAVASAAEAKAHADATAKGSDADTESSSHAGAAETGGVKGSGSGESHCGHSHHANEVQSDEKEFAHGMLLARLYMVGPKTSAIPRRVGVDLMFGTFNGTLEVEHGQQEEDQGLHELGKQEQGVDRDRGNDRCHDEEENEHDFFAADVTE